MPVLSGACNGCGKCCRHLTLVDRGRPIKEMAQFERMVERDPAFRFFRPLEQRDDDGYLYFSCLLLDDAGFCSDYDNRPQICRDYPNASMFRFGAELPSGCGYQVIRGRPFAEVLEEVVAAAGGESPAPWWQRLPAAAQRLFQDR